MFLEKRRERAEKRSTRGRRVPPSLFISRLGRISRFTDFSARNSVSRSLSIRFSPEERKYLSESLLENADHASLSFAVVERHLWYTLAEKGARKEK